MIATLYIERRVVIDSGPSTRRWISRVSFASFTASSSRPCMASTVARLLTDRSVTRVFGTEGPPLDRHHLLEDLLLLGELPHPVQDDGEVVHGPDGLRVLGAELLPAERDGALLLLERLLLVAQVPVAHAEGVSDRRLDEGLAGERRGDLGLGTVERLADRRVAAQPALLTLGPGGREHLVLEELEHGAGPRLRPFRLPELLGRVVPRLERRALGFAGPHGLPGAHAGARGDEQDKSRGGADQSPVLAREFPQAVRAATAARPRPARRAGSARCLAPGRWRSRSGGPDPSRGTS